MTPDLHPLVVTLNHPEVDGKLVYDPGCFWCREITAQPPPGTLPATPTTEARS